jgi:hypothetical protein
MHLHYQASRDFGIGAGPRLLEARAAGLAAFQAGHEAF